MKNDIQKTVIITYTNTFTKQVILTLQIPYIPFLATQGYYSGLYGKVKNSCAFGFEKSLVKGSIAWDISKSKRTIISYPSGLEFNMPYDITKDDIEIIKHYFEGVKMSLPSK